ncbi:MAG: hypothetical protein AAB676_03915 [Verrucomicrobiota bacterium]
MSETIDGSQPLADQESAIQFKEAKGYELTALAADETDPPMNTAEFKRLPIGQLPKRIHLTQGPVPAGGKRVWSGNIYIDGNASDALAYRK